MGLISQFGHCLKERTSVSGWLPSSYALSCVPLPLPGVTVWKLPHSLELEELGNVVEEGEDDHTENVDVAFEEPALDKNIPDKLTKYMNSFRTWRIIFFFFFFFTRDR